MGKIAYWVPITAAVMMATASFCFLLSSVIGIGVNIGRWVFIGAGTMLYTAAVMAILGLILHTAWSLYDSESDKGVG